MQQLPDALSALAHYRQFILYKLIPKNDGTGKVDKLPVDPRTLRVFARGLDWQNDPASCTDADTAISLAAGLGSDHGVGFLFTERDPFVFVDIDGALINGQWSDVAIEICARMCGAAVEVSQSHTGLHLIGAALNIPTHGCKNGTHGLEMYHTGRFVALTGLEARGNASHDVSGVLPALVADYFPPSQGFDGSALPAEWTTEPREGYTGSMDDEVLIPLMLGASINAGTVFSNKASLSDLWYAEPDALNRAYPDEYSGRAYDASKADAALSSHLAFWTGGDCERVERLMWRSALARDKWTSNHSYLRDFTITKAVARCQNIYTAGKKKKEKAPEPEHPKTASDIIPFDATAETHAFISMCKARLVRFNGAWFTREAEGFYRDLEDEIIRASVRKSCGWQLTTAKVNNTMDELKSVVVTDSHDVELPHWLSGGKDKPDARGLIVCKNGILDPVTDTLYPHDDSLLTFNALPFDYEPNAAAPVCWTRFLESIFKGDAESIHEMQKLFGYLLTLDTYLQKIFSIVGPKRSGKGTLARVLRELIGTKNVCSPSFNTIGDAFGLESLIGKQLAIFPDSRIGRRTDKATVAERLLSISGEDALDVGRKHRGDWHGKLQSRLLVLSNEVPVFGDASGALASRYVIFHTPDSFYGREDHGLTDRLLDELPGILNWALEGLQMLRREGRIRTPAVATELFDEMDNLGSPVKAFVNDSCQMGEGLRVAKDALWVAYRAWHNDHGVAGRPMSKEIFTRTIKTAYPGQLHEHRPDQPDETGHRPKYWSGLGVCISA